MGQTLTHGVYLPDEGERNCYNGLAGNWTILDGAVGTVAEHTTAIAGKAPAVHTHTKSDITDFPAYGTTAGTICEGNDSRLSDARAPVAHTHLTADVTDLFNSANTWTKTQNFVGEYQGNESSYNYNTCFAIYGRNDTVGKSGMLFTKYRPVKGQGNLVSADIIQYAVDVLENEARTNNTFLLQVSGYNSNTNKFTKIDVVSALSDSNLGNLSYKWKTLNGVNPGALSLPKVDGWNAGQDIDAVGIDTTNWDMTSGNWNELANNVHDGWIYFAFKNCSAGDRISVRYYGTDARFITLSFAPLSTGYMYAAFPLAKGFKANISFVTSGTVMSKFIYPCIGNV